MVISFVIFAVENGGMIISVITQMENLFLYLKTVNACVFSVTVLNVALVVRIVQKVLGNAVVMAVCNLAVMQSIIAAKDAVNAVRTVKVAHAYFELYLRLSGH